MLELMQEISARGRHGDRADHARPRRGRAHGRRRGRDVRRAGGGARHRWTTSSTATPTPTPPGCAGAAGRGARAGAAPAADRRQPARPARAAGGLRLRRALPARDADLRPASSRPNSRSLPVTARAAGCTTPTPRAARARERGRAMTPLVEHPRAAHPFPHGARADRARGRRRLARDRARHRHRAGRRERLGQVHAGQDPGRAARARLAARSSTPAGRCRGATAPPISAARRARSR